MNITLKIWRQKDNKTAGQVVTYVVKGVTADMSFLEMLDILNEELIGKGEVSRSRLITIAARGSAGRAVS